MLPKFLSKFNPNYPYKTDTIIPLRGQLRLTGEGSVAQGQKARSRGAAIPPRSFNKIIWQPMLSKTPEWGWGPHIPSRPTPAKRGN